MERAREDGASEIRILKCTLVLGYFNSSLLYGNLLLLNISGI